LNNYQVKTAKSVNRVGWFRLFSPLTHSIADGTGIPKNKFYNLSAAARRS